MEPDTSTAAASRLYDEVHKIIGGRPIQLVGRVIAHTVAELTYVSADREKAFQDLLNMVRYFHVEFEKHDRAEFEKLRAEGIKNEQQ